VFEWILKNKEWVFSGIGVIVVGFVISFIKKLFLKRDKQVVDDKKYKKETYKTNNGVVVGDNAYVGGNIAGHDIIINQDFNKKEIEELINIFKLRAENIISLLSTIDKYKDCLDRFIILHNKHIEALKKGNLVYAHEILRMIDKLSMFDYEDGGISYTIIYVDHLESEYESNENQKNNNEVHRAVFISTYITGEIGNNPDEYLYPQKDYWKHKNTNYLAEAYKKILKCATSN